MDDVDSTDFQHLFINTDVDLAPYSAFRAAMHASVLLAFALDHDAGVSISKLEGPFEQQYGMLTAKGFWPRLRVLESGNVNRGRPDAGGSRRSLSSA